MSKEVTEAVVAKIETPAELVREEELQQSNSCLLYTSRKRAASYRTQYFVDHRPYAPACNRMEENNENFRFLL